jgi:hypothetical protein
MVAAWQYSTVQAILNPPAGDKNVVNDFLMGSLNWDFTHRRHAPGRLAEEAQDLPVAPMRAARVEGA